MNEINELLNNLTELTQSFEKVEHLEQGVLSNESDIMDQIIDKVINVLKFVDGKIKIFDDEYYDGNNWLGKKEYYSEKGVIVAEDTSKYCESRFEHTLEGSMVILTRSGQLIRFSRHGHYSQFQNTPQLEVFTNDKIITSEDYLKEFPFNTFFEYLLKNFHKSIKDNENKEPMLKKRLDILSDIKQSLS